MFNSKANRKIDAFFKKFGYDVGYYSHLDEKVVFYDNLGDRKKHLVTVEDIDRLTDHYDAKIAELEETIKLLERFLKIEMIESEKTYKQFGR